MQESLSWGTDRMQGFICILATLLRTWIKRYMAIISAKLLRRFKKLKKNLKKLKQVKNMENGQIIAGVVPLTDSATVAFWLQKN